MALPGKPDLAVVAGKAPFKNSLLPMLELVVEGCMLARGAHRGKG
jgi:hypothetical protein